MRPNVRADTINEAGFILEQSSLVILVTLSGFSSCCHNKPSEYPILHTPPGYFGYAHRIHVSSCWFSKNQQRTKLYYISSHIIIIVVGCADYARARQPQGPVQLRPVPAARGRGGEESGPGGFLVSQISQPRYGYAWGGRVLSTKI